MQWLFHNFMLQVISRHKQCYSLASKLGAVFFEITLTTCVCLCMCVHVCIRVCVHACRMRMCIRLCVCDVCLKSLMGRTTLIYWLYLGWWGCAGHKLSLPGRFC